MSTVLILTSNLGLQYWLGQALTSAGFLVLPAKTPLRARELLSQLRLAIDLVITDPTLAGGSEFIERLRRSQGSLKILSVDLKAWEELASSKPTGPQADAAAQAEWVSQVQCMLSQAASA